MLRNLCKVYDFTLFFPSSDGDKWRRHRKLLTPTFHFQILETFLSVINKESSVLTKKLEAEAGKPWIDIVPMITMFTLDTICRNFIAIILLQKRILNLIFLMSLVQHCHLCSFAFNLTFLDYLTPLL